MSYFRTVIFITTLAASAACEAGPKPEMTYQQYQEVGANWALLNRCGETGLMSPDTATLGMRYILGNLRNYNYDHLKVQAEAMKLQDMVPTQVQCNQAAMVIADTKRSIDQRNALNAATADMDRRAWGEVMNNRPRQGYCNRFGVQVLCSSY